MRRILSILVCVLAPASIALASDGESSFTPTSFYVPLHSIMLMSSTGSGASELYHCPHGANSQTGSGDDAGVDPNAPGECFVDMADNTALSSLFTSAPIAINPGTYDQIVIGQCAAGAHGYSAYVTGSISLSGQTWYTTSGADAVLTTVLADNRPVTTDYSGCGTTINLPAPITLTPNDPAMSINAFFTLRNIAWATLTNNGPPGGCAFDVHGHSVCTGYPIPVAYLGADAPTLDIFHITEDLNDLTADKASGQMLILRSSTGSAFGGFSRRLLSAQSENPSVNYDTPLETLMLNPDGMSYLIENFGGGSPGGVAVPYYVHFPAFELQTHNGTFIQSDGVTMRNYRAVLQ